MKSKKKVRGELHAIETSNIRKTQARPSLKII